MYDNYINLMSTKQIPKALTKYELSAPLPIQTENTMGEIGMVKLLTRVLFI